MTVALAFGLSMTIVGAGAPAWATTSTPTPTADPVVTTSPTPTDSPTSDDIFGSDDSTPAPTGSPTTPAPISVDINTSPTGSPSPSRTPGVLPSGFPTDLIPSGIRSDLPDLIVPDLKLRGVCGPTGVTWTLKNIIDKKVGYAFIDSKLTWGLGKLEPGQKIVLSAHGFAILALPLDAETGLPYKLPTIGFLPCKAAGFGAVAATGGVGAVGAVGGAGVTTASTVTAVPATVAKPIVTSNVSFTG
jgi:hypothetical protein